STGAPPVTKRLRDFIKTLGPEYADVGTEAQEEDDGEPPPQDGAENAAPSPEDFSMDLQGRDQEEDAPCPFRWPEPGPGNSLHEVRIRVCAPDGSRHAAWFGAIFPEGTADLRVVHIGRSGFTDGRDKLTVRVWGRAADGQAHACVFDVAFPGGSVITDARVRLQRT